jgi:transglutaminase-like putative cysteine protease
MSRRLKALTIILAVAVAMVIGLIVVSKTTDNFMGYNEDETSISQNGDVSVGPKTDDESSETPETPAVSGTATNEITEMASASYSSSAEIKPTTTAAPIPEVPESTSDDAQMITSTSMNGYIYISYKSDKKVKIMMDNGERQEVYDLVSDGKFHRFTLHLGDGDYLIRLVENTEGTSYRVVESVEFNCSLISEHFPYLVPNSFVVYDNDMEVIRFGLTLTEDETNNDQKTHALYDWIVRNISYDFSVVGKLEVGYVPNPQTTYETRKGICSDFAALFASLCRSQGIPCKVVLGYYVKSEDYHAWNEVLVNGEYVIVDTSGDSQTKVYGFSRTDGYTKNKEH